MKTKPFLHLHLEGRCDQQVIWITLKLPIPIPLQFHSSHEFSQWEMKTIAEPFVPHCQRPADEAWSI